MDSELGLQGFYGCKEFADLTLILLSIKDHEYQSKIDILNDNFIEMKNYGEEMQNKNKSLEDEVKSLQGLLKMMESDNTKSNNEVTIMQMNLK